VELHRGGPGAVVAARREHEESEGERARTRREKREASPGSFIEEGRGRVTEKERRSSKPWLQGVINSIHGA
jgi:hypothetical protein